MYLEQPRLALPYLQRAVELNERDVEALFQLGLCLAQLEFVDEAMTYFQQTIALDERHADAHYNLGVAYAYKDDIKTALEMFTKALDIQPDHLLAGHGKKLMEKALQQ
jgi:tetratricopeptide (TPR) repeat protein